MHNYLKGVGRWMTFNMNIIIVIIDTKTHSIEHWTLQADIPLFVKIVESTKIIIGYQIDEKHKKYRKKHIFV